VSSIKSSVANPQIFGTLWQPKIKRLALGIPDDDSLPVLDTHANIANVS
jgi:hypothetical protein